MPQRWRQLLSIGSHINSYEPASPTPVAEPMMLTQVHLQPSYREHFRSSGPAQLTGLGLHPGGPGAKPQPVVKPLLAWPCTCLLLPWAPCGAGQSPGPSGRWPAPWPLPAVPTGASPPHKAREHGGRRPDTHPGTHLSHHPAFPDFPHLPGRGMSQPWAPSYTAHPGFPLAPQAQTQSNCTQQLPHSRSWASTQLIVALNHGM